VSDPAHFVLRAEGVNFAATLFDTQDISTIRGAGLALLELPDKVRACIALAGITLTQEVLVGASQYACEFSASPTDAEALSQAVKAALETTATPPFAHLSFVVDLAEGKGEAALAAAEARNHARQFRQWTLRLPAFDKAAAGFDGFDRVRPAVCHVGLPHDKFPAGSEADGARLSASTAARFSYGRKMRQKFYRAHAQASADDVRFHDLAFTDSVEDMVDAPPQGLPLSLRHGVAVFYADGNGFGEIRKRARATFSETLNRLRTALLQQILLWLAQGRGDPAFAITTKTGTPRLRFETLLWGGDEMMFVMPAWLAFAFTAGFFAATANWKIGDHALTHAAGLVICHSKTPIRQARDLAHELAEGIKEAGRSQKGGIGNAVALEMFEGLMPPLDGLETLRQRLYGGQASNQLTLSLAFPGNGFAAMRARCRALAQGETLPRSQLYRILRALRGEPGGLPGEAANQKAAEMLNEYAARVHLTKPTQPALPSIVNRGLALDLALLARCWDYADPLAGAAITADFPPATPP
jgi:hypothetical protein